jgi:hypothetical protein
VFAWCVGVEDDDGAVVVVVGVVVEEEENNGDNMGRSRSGAIQETRRRKVQVWMVDD